MPITYKDNRIVVMDDFLSEDEQLRILQYFDIADFRAILPEAWGRGFKLTNGNPLVGIEILSEQGIASERLARPTQTPVDLLIDKLDSAAQALGDIVGAKGKDWSHFTVCPYVYPSGSGLGWHSDKHGTGAYIYYAHSEWRNDWGGELLVTYATKDCEQNTSSNRGIFRNEAIERSLEAGLGYYFSPRPNRAIFIRQGTPHMIKEVDKSAGDRLRLSVAGFFIRNAGC